MDLWFLYALLSAIFAWLSSFFVKVWAEKKYNPFLFTAYSFASYSLFALIFYIFSWDYLNNLKLLIIVSIIMWISYLWTLILRIESLKNIGTIFYFPIYKIFSTIIAFIVWLYLFNDTLEINEVIWIIFWLIVPIVLISKKEKLKQNNLLKWIILCLISWVLAVVSVAMSKIVKINDLNIYLYMLVWGWTWLWISLIQYYRTKSNYKMDSKVKRVSILSWSFIFIATVFFVKAMSWNMWTVYTINSFSILIPIILSLIFYKEKLDLRKIIAIILTILSMLFFKVF